MPCCRGSDVQSCRRPALHTPLDLAFTSRFTTHVGCSMSKRRAKSPARSAKPLPPKPPPPPPDVGVTPLPAPRRHPASLAGGVVSSSSRLGLASQCS